MYIPPKQLLFGLTILAMVIAGCTPLHHETASRRIHFQGQTIDLGDEQAVQQILYDQLREWEGAPYQIGGLTKEGIDCSGFVYMTFLSKFGIRLPRSARLQADAGSSVLYKNLKAGDLLFFKTGVNSRHVGIYLEEKQFIHASKSSGVMISRLDDGYWSSRYWKAVRIKVNTPP